MLIVEKFPWANTLDVTHGVEEALADLRPGMPGVEVDAAIFRPATFIEEAIQNLTTALLLGCLLVVFVLVAFLFDWRAALISLVAIPLSLMAAALVLHIRGATINTMVLAGFVIAVGVVVDDAIIDVENIIRRLRQHRAEGSSTPVALHRPRVVPGGSAGYRLRDAHRRGDAGAGLLHRRPVRRLLPAARDLVRASPCWPRCWWR